MRSVALADEYSYAVQVAESHLAAVEQKFQVEAGEQSGQKNSAYAWQINAADWSRNPKRQIRKVTVNRLQLYQVESIVT